MKYNEKAGKATLLWTSLHTQNICHFCQAFLQVWLSWGHTLALFKVEGSNQVKTLKNSIVSAFVFKKIRVWNNEFQNQGCKFLENQTKNKGNKEEFHQTPQVTSPALQFHLPPQPHPRNFKCFT